jgi:hypothetical protein
MRGISFILFSLTIGSPAMGALEFSGFMQTGEELRIVLTDLETGKSSGFLAVGESFHGHKIVGLTKDVLTVEREGKRFELSLKADGVKDGKATLPGEKTNVAVGVTIDGKAMLGGRTVSFDELDAELKRLAEKGAPLQLAIHEPPSPNQTSHEATKRVMESLERSGAKKWSLKIVNAADAKQAAAVK